jgi:hypothetical protein
MLFRSKLAGKLRVWRYVRAKQGPRWKGRRKETVRFLVEFEIFAEVEGSRSKWSIVRARAVM